MVEVAQYAIDNRIDLEPAFDWWVRDIIKRKDRLIKMSQSYRLRTGYQRIPHNIIFEIKMDLTRKARLVAGGHKTAPPTQLTYSSVVSRESVRLGFLLAAPNDVDIVAADVGNAYLNATTKEKVYIITGPEFRPLEEEKVAVIVRALYGLKSSGAMWRSHFAANLRDMGFTSSLGDPDVWFRAAEKPDKS